ncbi:MAG: hypothetical protein LBH22_06880 [Bacteroidales bacterium]|jgi:hypothetical protein|nr:hypothetical protein [Bacteroidales bacterium]
MKKISYTLLICFAFNIVECFAEENFRERIYLQTDKHLYLAGESILLKLVTTDTEQTPTAFSKIAYVELVKDSIAKLQIIVELNNGIGTGQMVLPADLPTGYYRLIAYTQFMRNETNDAFFEKNIAILNTFLSDYHPSETENHVLSNKENYSSSVSVQSDKTVYKTRERGELILTGLPENMHTLSVTIAGKEWIPIVESNISLFQKNKTKKTTEFFGEFLPEYEGHIITGKIVRNKTEESANLLPGIAFPGEGINFFSGQINASGDVWFVTSSVLGTTEIATIVYNVDDNYRVDIVSPFITRFTPKQMPMLHIDSAYYEQLIKRSTALQLFRYFSEDFLENQNVSESFFKVNSTHTYLLDEYTRFTTMQEVFTEFITGTRFRRRGGNWEMSILTKRGNTNELGTHPLILLDGIPVSDHNVIFNYDPLLVERINIYYGPYTFGGHLFDGIVELTTYRRDYQNLNFTGSLQVVGYVGPQSPYQFTTPDYSNENQRRSRIPDGRHTLLWNPNVISNGKTSVRLPFDTSDLTGEFQIIVEGITKDGKFIHATSYFKVSEN